MTLRPTQSTIFSQVRSGLQLNLARLTHAQEQVASGKRILRPSDDPVGASLAVSVRRERAGLDGYLSVMNRARPLLATASSQLQEGSSLVAQARSLLLQSMNGTLSAADRETVAGQLELTYQALLEVGNSRSGERYLFGGTAHGGAPFREVAANGVRRVEYGGDRARATVLIGRDARLALNVPGDAAFGSGEYTGTRYSGLTGIASGTSADSGEGYTRLLLRNELTSGALGAGIAFVQTGDTVLGEHELVVDGAAGTITLGSGAPAAIPSPLEADFVVRDADGSELHLDLSGYTGGGFTATITGQGSISLDGASWTPIDFTETDLELIDPTGGTVLHVDTSGVSRAGEELVTFGGTPNLFDTLLGAIGDLRSSTEVDQGDVLQRLGTRLGELDRGFDQLQIANGELGSSSARLDSTENRSQELRVQLDGLLSSVEDADVAEAVLEMSRAEQTLQLAQATGARLLQQTLLNYLR